MKLAEALDKFEKELREVMCFRGSKCPHCKALKMIVRLRKDLKPQRRLNQG
jgi:hypothetical protein